MSETPAESLLDDRLRAILWQQFGAAIAMLAQPLRACPDELWRARLWSEPYSEFWNIGYHALFWLDLYLSGRADGFQPPAPFTLDELDPEGRLPERSYSRDELLAYIAHAQAKCRATIATLTEEQADRKLVFGWGEMPFVELQLYSMRHVQEHAAQLSLLLGQRTGAAPAWIGRATGGLSNG